MANYYSSLAVEQHGRLMGGFKDRAEFGERKIAIVDNGLWRIASDDPDDLLAQYKSGFYLTYRPYGVPVEKLPACADKGREPTKMSDDQP